MFVFSNRRAPSFTSIESQISSIVNQYGNAPLGESPVNFDASQLDNVPELGPREINLDIVSPSQFQPRLDPIPIRNLELLWKWSFLGCSIDGGRSINFCRSSSFSCYGHVCYHLFGATSLCRLLLLNLYERLRLTKINKCVTNCFQTVHCFPVDILYKIHIIISYVETIYNAYMYLLFEETYLYLVWKILHVKHKFLNSQEISDLYFCLDNAFSFWNMHR